LRSQLFESTDLHVHVEPYKWTVDEIRHQYSPLDLQPVKLLIVEVRN
jgi:hypothetical protein